MFRVGTFFFTHKRLASAIVESTCFDLFTNFKWQAKQRTFAPRSYFFFTSGFGYIIKTYFF